MDINWDQIQQILTFLIIFVAPAILSRFKKERDDDEVESPLDALKHEDLAGTKPINLKAIQKESEEGATRALPEESLEKKHEIKQKSFRPPPKKVKPVVEEIKVKKKDSRQAPEEIAAFAIPDEKKSSAQLLGLSPRKAMILKEVLDSPRGLRPY